MSETTLPEIATFCSKRLHFQIQSLPPWTATDFRGVYLKEVPRPKIMAVFCCFISLEGQSLDRRRSAVRRDLSLRLTKNVSFA